jgi:hypothetical protein
MDLSAMIAYGPWGAGLAAVAWLVSRIVKRGLKLEIRAEIPPKGSADP